MGDDERRTSTSPSFTKRIRFATICCSASLLLVIFSYLNYFGDYSNTVIYFVLPSSNNNINNVGIKGVSLSSTPVSIQLTTEDLFKNDLNPIFNDTRQRELGDDIKLLGTNFLNRTVQNSIASNLSVQNSVTVQTSTVTNDTADFHTVKTSTVPGELNNITNKPRECFIPKLVVDDPSLKHLMKHHEPLKCSPMKNWVYTWNGKFYIDSATVKNFGEVTCDYIHIERIDEYKYKEVVYANYKNGSDLLGDAFRVACHQDKAKKRFYTNVHVGVPKLKQFEASEATETNSTNDSFKPHVLIYLLDSMSRINFIRKLPKFYKTLTEKLDGTVMEGFNVVGDGTPWAVIPMTTGHFQTELPEARKRFNNATYIDDWPFIFNDYREAGYATSYVEEQPLFSAFTYKLKGFKKPPVDHYLRTMLLVAEKRKNEHKPYCLGDTPKSLVWLKYWRELRNLYDQKNRSTFSFLFSSETSHDDYNLVQVMDDHLSLEFESLQRASYLNNTIVLVMGDHGRRFGPVRQTQSGKLEEKLPFLAVITPPSFKEKFPKSYANLKTNSDRLVTVFDLHATLKRILDFRFDGGVGDVGQREISLFDEIPENRTCDDAQIKPHFCSCLKWTDIDDPGNDAVVRNATDIVINRFNEMNAEAKGLCAQLTVNRILSARMMAPRDELMAFKESQDYDNYLPDLSGNKKVTAFIYQIRFTTKPSDADYEVSVTYFEEYNRFVFSDNDVSRLNMYGDQPKCIINTFHHLRQYCYCLKK